MEDRWIESEHLYEALEIHKKNCCDCPSLHFEEDKNLFQQQFELKKKLNIDLMIKTKSFPKFNQRSMHPIDKILRLDSQSFKTYPCFGKKYFEKYENEMNEKKKSLTEQKLIELRQHFAFFYHAKLDFMNCNLISREIRKRKKNYMIIKK